MSQWRIKTSSISMLALVENNFVRKQVSTIPLNNWTTWCTHTLLVQDQCICSLVFVGADYVSLASRNFCACVLANAASRICTVILWMPWFCVFVARVQRSPWRNWLSYLSWAFLEVSLEGPSWPTLLICSVIYHTESGITYFHSEVQMIKNIFYFLLSPFLLLWNNRISCLWKLRTSNFKLQYISEYMHLSNWQPQLSDPFLWPKLNQCCSLRTFTSSMHLTQVFNSTTHLIVFPLARTLLYWHSCTNPHPIQLN